MKILSPAVSLRWKAALLNVEITLNFVDDFRIWIVEVACQPHEMRIIHVPSNWRTRHFETNKAIQRKLVDVGISGGQSNAEKQSW